MVTLTPCQAGGIKGSFLFHKALSVISLAWRVSVPGVACEDARVAADGDPPDDGAVRYRPHLKRQGRTAV